MKRQEEQELREEGEEQQKVEMVATVQAAIVVLAAAAAAAACWNLRHWRLIVDSEGLGSARRQELAVAHEDRLLRDSAS